MDAFPFHRRLSRSLFAPARALPTLLSQAANLYCDSLHLSRRVLNKISRALTFIEVFYRIITSSIIILTHLIKFYFMGLGIAKF